MVARQKGISSLYALLFVGVVVIGIGGYYVWNNLNSQPDLETDLVERPLNDKGEAKSSPSTAVESTTNPVPPANAKPIASGSVSYLVSGKFTGPAISKVTIDPHDAKAGQQQKIRVEVSDSNPVTRVYVTVKLDTKSNTFDLKLVEGTATQGVWEGSAPFPDDTLFTNYTIIENAESATGKSTTTTTIR